MRLHIAEAWRVYDSHVEHPALRGREPRYISIVTVAEPRDAVCVVAEVPPGLEHLVENALATAERIVALHNAGL